MAKQEQIVLELVGKTTKLEASLKRVKKDFKKTDKQVDKMRISTAGLRRGIGALRNNMLLVSFALGGTAASVGKLVSAYGQQQLAEKKLSAALGFTSKALLTQASALQQTTAFGDEAIIGVQALIGAFTKDEEQIKELTKTTLDLAAAKGMELTAAADLVSKSFGSSTNALSRYGIQVEGAVGSTERLENLTGNVAALFGGQAVAQADTMTGSIEQMKNAIGDTAEAMGGIMEPATISLSKSIKEVTEGWTEFFLELKETSLETTVRHLRELGVESEKLQKLTDTINMRNFTENLQNAMFSTTRLLEGQEGLSKFASRLTDEQLKQMGFQLKIEKFGYRKLEATNLELVTSEKINKVLDEQTLKTFQIIDGKSVLTKKEQEQVDKLEAQRELMFQILQSTIKREQLEQNILDIRNGVEAENDPKPPDPTAFDLFAEKQKERLEAYESEQAFIEKLQSDEGYAGVAEKLGLLTDAQKEDIKVKAEARKAHEKDRADYEKFMDKQKKDEDTLSKVRKEQGMQFLKNLQSATKGQKQYAGVFKAAAITETTITTAQAMMAAYKSMVGIPIYGVPLGIAASAAAGVAGAVQIQQIAAAQYGMNEVVDEPTMILAGEAGAEQVSITPLESPNIDGVQSGGASVVVNVSGNVLTSDFVEGELADNIREAVRRGTDFGIG